MLTKYYMKYLKQLQTNWKYATLLKVNAVNYIGNHIYFEKINH